MSGGSGGPVYLALNKPAAVTTHTFTGVTARYLRLTITTPTQITDPAARIYELKAFA